MQPFDMADPSDWNLDRLLDRERTQRLLDPPLAEDVLALLCHDAWDAAMRGAISSALQDGTSMRGCIRAHAIVPVSRDTFDALINGRSGYRAQYYLSAANGALFNRLAVIALLAPLQQAWGTKDRGVEYSRSLVGPWSKIGVTGDRTEFDAAPLDEFRPRKWFERVGQSEWLTVPLPDNPSLDVKGTWLADGQYKPDPDKADRDQTFYERGHA